MKKGFLNTPVEKCLFISDNGKKCYRPKSVKIAKEENPEGYCTYHYEQNKEKDVSFNTVCAICIEEGETDESGKMYPLGCTHRFHVNCLSGMTKAECPMCRKPAINLSKKIKDKIDENAEKYRRETQEQEERDFLEMMESENFIYQQVRLPPNVEVILALKYLVQLGVPVSLIPLDTVLEIDPQSPLPEPGSIFQNTVKRLLETIQQRVSLAAVEEEETIDLEVSDHSELNEDDPFEFEGEDLQIVHRVRTIPHGEMTFDSRLMSALRHIFSTVTFQISNLPDLTQEDLINLRMGRIQSEQELEEN